MPLDKEVGLGPDHIVLDGDPVETQPPQHPLPTFGPCLLWPNGRPSHQLLSSCYINGRCGGSLRNLYCKSTRLHFYQILSIWVKIWQSYCKKLLASFHRDTVY